ncbi:MAG TPA: radical SAM protein [Phycisphaerae bacterium]|nr:radical SAM protein [Phycisphaerae bacterium]HNU45695.1 radical SAM protein [Phycisphaerae bacterium]
MNVKEITRWLREDDDARLDELWREADDVRRRSVGDAVHLRGLIEFSNHCGRLCLYCGLRVENRAIDRYRMSADEVLDCARQAVEFGYGTVVLQSGEDLGTTREWLVDVVRRMKAETPLAVTLSVGERSLDDLRAWRAAGADRYLLRFETSNRTLFERIHPPRDGRPSDRPAMLRQLRDLGYEVGSGVMIGIPGQTYADLARDLEWFAELDLDMIGVGPFLPHPATPLGAAAAPASVVASAPGGRRGTSAGSSATASPAGGRRYGPVVPPTSEDPPPPAATSGQVPNTELMTYKVIALARLLCPLANIPSTTALATVNRAEGRELGLRRGANVVMPNLTPAVYRRQYEIYPAKACISEEADACHHCLTQRIAALGRSVGSGRGDSLNRLRCPAGARIAREATP